MLETIQRGKLQLPPRLLIYGTEKIGKSTLCAAAPKPVFIQTEDGLDNINCDRFPLATKVEDVFNQIAAVGRDEHDYRTLVIDSLDWLEQLIFERVCSDAGVDSIEKVDGGYGKGYVAAIAAWRKLTDWLNKLRAKRSMVILLIAHAKVERFEDPEASPYDRYAPRLNKHAAALMSEWCDAILFATRKMRVDIKDAAFGRKRATAHAIGADGGDRILRCIGSPSCLAGNRYQLPAELPLSWQSLSEALDGVLPK